MKVPTRSFSIAVVVCSALLSSGVAAHCLDADRKQAELAALSTAQTVYVMEDDLAPNASPRRPTPDFAAFYNAFQTLGRFQFLPSTRGADLILRYGGQGEDRELDVIDPKTLTSLRTWSEWSPTAPRDPAERLKMSDRLLRKLQDDLSGTAAKPPIPLALAAEIPDSPIGPGRSSRFATSHKVYVIDQGVPPKFPGHEKSPYGPHELSDLLKATLNSRYRYQVVDSLADADLVMTLSSSWYSTLPFLGLKAGWSHPFSELYEPEFVLSIRDARTLQEMGRGSCSPGLKTRQIQVDSKTFTMMTLVHNAFNNVRIAD